MRNNVQRRATLHRPHDRLETRPLPARRHAYLLARRLAAASTHAASQVPASAPPAWLQLSVSGPGSGWGGTYFTHAPDLHVFPTLHSASVVHLTAHASPTHA